MSLLKKSLSPDEVAAQMALELPVREMFEPVGTVDLTVVISNAANHGSVVISLDEAGGVVQVVGNIQYNIVAQICTTAQDTGQLVCTQIPVQTSSPTPETPAATP